MHLKPLFLLFGAALLILGAACPQTRTLLQTEREARAETLPPAALRVCADPDYLPFSNRAGEGFENAIAQVIAGYLGEPVEYTWRSYRGIGGFEEFLTRTLNAHRCDLIMDLPYGSSEALTTDPYYVSSYVFVVQRDKRYDLSSMDSPVLRQLKVGFEQYTPAENGLKLRGLVQTAIPFDIGEHASRSPQEVLKAVHDGKVDVMITWEPAIGAFLPDHPELRAVPVPDERVHGPPERYSFPMSMAVRNGDHALAERINSVIRDHKPELIDILQHHGVRLYKPSTEPNALSEM